MKPRYYWIKTTVIITGSYFAGYGFGIFIRDLTKQKATIQETNVQYEQGRNANLLATMAAANIKKDKNS